MDGKVTQSVDTDWLKCAAGITFAWKSPSDQQNRFFRHPEIRARRDWSTCTCRCLRPWEKAVRICDAKFGGLYLHETVCFVLWRRTMCRNFLMAAVVAYEPTGRPAEETMRRTSGLFKSPIWRRRKLT